MNQEEVESQLSAMFDGELPAAECELLSRRIDRDEILRARWARYALIGAAMRSEPVATARKGFAQRVSAALARDGRAHTPRGALRQRYRSTAVAAVLVGSVAGLSILLLRSTVPQPPAAGAPAGSATSTQLAASQLPATLQAVGGQSVSAQPTAAGGEPVSYVTPPGTPETNLPLRSELANFIVAHTEYSVPLMQPDLLSELVSSEAVVGVLAPPGARAGASPQATVNAPAAARGHGR